MANPTENLSPEEKLLRVIQGGKKAKAGPENAPAPMNTATSVAATAPVAVAEARPAATRGADAAADKPKLKVSKGAESAGSPATATPSAKGDAKADAKARAADPKAAKRSTAAGAAARPKSADGGGDFSVRTVNIVLAVAVLIVLFMTGHEIWANVRVQVSDLRVGEVNLPPLDLTKADQTTLPLDDVLDAVDQRPLFAVANPKEVQPPPVDERGPDKYCILMGISVYPDGKSEAIIKDDKDNMLFLKEGDSITGDGQNWIVHEIQGEQVIFRNGDRESVVRGAVSRQQ